MQDLDLSRLKEMLKDEFDKESISIREHNSWLRIRRDEEPAIRKLGNAARLYLYMRTNINRSRLPDTWANLDKYFEMGHLAFAKNHTYICEDFGVDRHTIGVWANKLIECGAVIILNKETEFRQGDAISILVYGLGLWDYETEINRREAFYLNSPRLRAYLKSL